MRIEQALRAPGRLQPTAVYRLRGHDGELLYIGVTIDIGRRLHTHAASKPWWSEVATVDVDAHPSWQDAVDAEEEAIPTEQPRWNVAGKTLRAATRRAATGAPRFTGAARRERAQRLVTIAAAQDAVSTGDPASPPDRVTTATVRSGVVRVTVGLARAD